MAFRKKNSIMLLVGFKLHLFYQVLILWGGTFSEDRDLTTNSLVLTATKSELHDSKTCKSDSENDANTENKHVLENGKNARHDQKETNLEEGNTEVSVQKLNSPPIGMKDVNNAIISPKQPEAVKGLSITVTFFIVLSALITVLCLCMLVIFLWPKCRVCIAKLKGTSKNNLNTSDVFISNSINPYMSDNPGQNVRDTDNASNSSDLFTSDIIKSRIHNILRKGRTLQADSCDNPGQNAEDTDNTSTSSDLFTSNPKSRLYRVFKHDDVSLSSDSSNLRENVQETDNTSNSSDVYPSKIIKSRIYRIFKKDVSLSSDSCDNQRQNAQETDNTSNSSDLFTPNIPKP